MVEELFRDGEETTPCSFCGNDVVPETFQYNNTHKSSAKWREIMQKGQEMRNKLQGKTPFRKSSYSQTGNE